MRSSEQLIHKADEAIKNNLLKGDGIKDSTISAIAGFGAAAINSGIEQTLKIYQANHPEIFKALDSFFVPPLHKIEAPTKWQLRLKKEQYINAAVALKIVARTYKIVNNEQ